MKDHVLIKEKNQLKKLSIYRDVNEINSVVKLVDKKVRIIRKRK